MRERTPLSLLKLFAALTFVMGMSVAGSAQIRTWPTPLPTPRHAPELNPATGATALALLTGGILVIRGRKK